VRLTFMLAVEADADEVAALRTAAADHLTARFGRGHWSHPATARSVLHSMRHARLVTARFRGSMVALARVATKKPWAIDVAYFTPCRRPLYLTDMVVAPRHQRKGVGRQCVEEVVRVARSWPGDALRLDAYDAPAGAGAFYAGCGFRECGRVTYRATPLVYYEMLLQEAGVVQP
jgi:GNAT superfamily N-acetyltransferase